VRGLTALGVLSGLLLACSGDVGANPGTGRKGDDGSGDRDGVDSSDESSSADDDDDGVTDEEPGGSAGTTPKARPISLAGDPIYSRVVRLTNEQWAASVRDVFALDTPPDAVQSFERPVAGTTDFANNEHVLSVTNAQWQAYQLASEQVATSVSSTPQKLAAVYSGSDGEGFVRKLGRRLFRRPLSSAEQQSYMQLFDRGAGKASGTQNFAQGAALVIRGLLQSPHFLYRTELVADGAQLSGYEAAAKLSLWLLGTTPDEALLDAAAAGKLDTAKGVATSAAEMLERPAAAVAVQEFHRELAHFDLFTTISKVGVAAYSEEMNLEFEKAAYMFFDRIFRSGLGLREVLTSTTGYVGPKMAAIYGVKAPASGLEERELGAARAGYFTQLPFLALYAFNEQPDPIHRGVTLNLEFLCANPGTPAANLPPIPPLKPGQTNREMITTLTSGCGGSCHNNFINPIGFAFEAFDGMGRVRTKDNGKPVDTKSAYPFAEGYKSFDGAAQLMKLMAEGKQAHTCYAKKIASYALQRDIVAADAPLLDALAKISQQGGSMKKVMLALVEQPAFRTRLGAKQ
jgi:hypothetical protein